METEEIFINGDSWGLQVTRRFEHQVLSILELRDRDQVLLLKKACEKYLMESEDGNS